MANLINIKRGLNIRISGAASPTVKETEQSALIALSPDDFEGIVPKVAVNVGDTVKAGSTIFFDKNHPELKIVSPVSGTVREVARGERRKLLYISIERDQQTTYESFEKIDLNATRAEIHAALLNAGFGAFIRQRPYDVVANPTILPKAIFVSGFDTAPLAPDYNFIAQNRIDDLQIGLTTLSKLTDGKVYFSVNENSLPEMKSLKNVEINTFCGAHPAGNVGTQINRLCPVNKGETVWTMNLQDVIIMGQFVQTAQTNFTKTVAITGPEVIAPYYAKVTLGSNIASLVDGNVNKNISLRYISGNILSGSQIAADGFLKAFDSQITVIAEGDHADELFGWIMPRFNKFSNSNLFLSKFITKLCPKKKFDFDARILGGKRAFIMSGEIEKVFPMDILPEALIKAMIAKNLDKMEALGAYEVAPEDFALCEFVCSSKIEMQSIVRASLNYMKKELE